MGFAAKYEEGEIDLEIYLLLPGPFFLAELLQQFR